MKSDSPVTRGDHGDDDALTGRSLYHASSLTARVQELIGQSYRLPCVNGRCVIDTGTGSRLLYTHIPNQSMTTISSSVDEGQEAQEKLIQPMADSSSSPSMDG